MYVWFETPRKWTDRYLRAKFCSNDWVIKFASGEGVLAPRERKGWKIGGIKGKGLPIHTVSPPSRPYSLSCPLKHLTSENLAQRSKIKHVSIKRWLIHWAPLKLMNQWPWFTFFKACFLLWRIKTIIIAMSSEHRPGASHSLFLVLNKTT